jgi:hypothetical protein
MTVPEQLTTIYYQYETWQKSWMKPEEAVEYHKSRYENGDIYTIIENEEVVAYYERYTVFNACILYNVWVKPDCRRGRVWRELKKHFFDTLPKNVTIIQGEKVKLGGKQMKVSIKEK